MEITIVTAKIAKELDFDWPCEVAYNTKAFTNRYANKEKGQYVLGGYRNKHPILVSLPLQSKLASWIRTKHKLYIEVYPVQRNKLSGSMTLFNWKMKKLNIKNRMQTRISGDSHVTYELALEEALEMTLKYIK